MCASRVDLDVLADKAWTHLCETYLNFAAVDRHRQVMAGIPTRDLKELQRLLYAIPMEEVHRSLGYAPPLAGRCPSRLPISVSNTFLVLLEVSGQAAQLLGTRKDAQHWLMKPLMGLDGYAPLELLSTNPGQEAVKTLMLRIEYGVCA